MYNMIQISFLFLNAVLSVSTSILLLLNLTIDINIKEILLVLSCVTSVNNLYTIYKLIKPVDYQINNSISIDDEDNLYVISENEN